MSHADKCFSTDRMDTGLSSTTKARFLAKTAFRSKVDSLDDPDAPSIGNVKATVTVVPSPGSAFTTILPFMASTKMRVIGIPSMLSARIGDGVDSTNVTFSNNAFASSALMADPVS